jgi:hypothetical protein
MQMMKVFVGFMSGVVCAVLVCFSGFVTTKKITGLYTDMEFHEESGDVSGVEVFLVRSKQGAFVTFQWAEGSPFVPVVVPAKISGQRISFELPEVNGSISGVFDGEVANDAIHGRFLNGIRNKDGGDIFVLKKKESYWQ